MSTAQTTATTDKGQREAAVTRARQAAAARWERERNWKRLVLVGAFASFSTLVGVVAAMHELSSTAANQPGLSAPAAGQTQQVVVPRVRTRTS